MSMINPFSKGSHSRPVWMEITPAMMAIATSALQAFGPEELRRQIRKKAADEQR
jgi:hypothetical protein